VHDALAAKVAELGDALVLGLELGRIRLVRLGRIVERALADIGGIAVLFAGSDIGIETLAQCFFRRVVSAGKQERCRRHQHEGLGTGTFHRVVLTVSIQQSRGNGLGSMLNTSCLRH